MPFKRPYFSLFCFVFQPQVAEDDKNPSISKGGRYKEKILQQKGVPNWARLKNVFFHELQNLGQIKTRHSIFL
jgi:hypothetical protein